MSSGPGRDLEVAIQNLNRILPREQTEAAVVAGIEILRGLSTENLTRIGSPIRERSQKL